MFFSETTFAESLRMLITDSNMTGIHAPPSGDSTPEVQEESRTAPRPALAPNCETKKINAERENYYISEKVISYGNFKTR